MGDSLLDETAAYISERSRKSKQLKKYDSPIKNKVGHTSSTLLNSCSFQRYRLLSVKASLIFLTHPLTSFTMPSMSISIIKPFLLLVSSTMAV